MNWYRFRSHKSHWLDRSAFVSCARHGNFAYVHLKQTAMKWQIPQIYWFAFAMEWGMGNREMEKKVLNFFWCSLFLNEFSTTPLHDVFFFQGCDGNLFCGSYQMQFNLYRVWTSHENDETLLALLIHISNFCLLRCCSLCFFRDSIDIRAFFFRLWKSAFIRTKCEGSENMKFWRWNQNSAVSSWLESMIRTSRPPW